MNPKVSVIVPLYNSSKYVSKCCRSLFSQTLDCLEFIFVDAGSSDGSLGVVRQILQEFPHRAGQVRVISHLASRGVGSSRHIGIGQATGDFIIHCDSDDWVEKEAYQLLYEKAIETGTDVVTCGYSIDTESGVQKEFVPAYTKDDINFSFDIGPQIGSLCLKLIRRDFIMQHHLQVPEDIEWGEDLCLSLEALLLCDKVETVDEPLYHYVQHKDSITHNVTKKQCLSLIKCGTEIEFFLKEKDLEDQHSFQLNWLKFQLKQYLLIFPQTRDIHLWKSIYPECHQHILQYKTMTYLKVTAWLIVHRFESTAFFFLRLRDILSNFKNK